MREYSRDLGYFSLYGIYNKDKLVYVGVTKCGLKRRLYGHDKFNFDEDTAKVLMIFPTREEAEEWETFFIKHHNLIESGRNEATGPGTTGVKQSKEWIRKKVESRAGYRCSEETIGNMREGKRHKMHKIICNETGVEYESIAAACRDLGLHSSKVSQVVRGKRKSVKGYTFSRVNNS